MESDVCPAGPACPICAARAERARREAEPDWKAIALYLADCHAATAGYDCELKSVSEGRKRRLRDICAEAAAFLTGDASPRHHPAGYEASVILRCKEASREQ